MGTITTGTGLISGLPIADIVKQLMAIEARPLDQLKARIKTTTEQRTALLEVSARLMAIKSGATRFDEASYFRSAKATSSNTDALTATAAEGTATGTYTFQVHSLATNHQIISRGMSDKDQTPVGSGTLTIETGKGALNPSTSLEMLNGGAGVQRGIVRITDRSGRTADVDLSAAFTIDDVLKAFNSRIDIGVKARVQGDHLVITDASGGTGSLLVMDVGEGRTAADLGIAGSSSGAQIVGSRVLQLGTGTSLGILNDGNGVRRAGGLGDDFVITRRDGKTLAINLSGRLQFKARLEELNSGNGVRLGTVRITNRAGQTGTVDLTGARTIEDVVNRLSAAKVDGTQDSLRVNIAAVSSSLQITDTSVLEGQKAASDLIIEDVSGYAARDLGIAGKTSTASLRGNTIYRIRTVGDVLRAINYASGNEDGLLQASVADDGFRLVLSDMSAGSGATTVTAQNDSKAAYDLGLLDAATGQLASRRILAGLDTTLLKSLNGGKGVGAGAIRITAGNGTTTALDLSGAETVQDVLDFINATTNVSKVRAELSRSGLGIVITDLSGGAGPMTIADLTGTIATDLHIAGSATGRLSSGNLQLQYIGEATELSQLNGGRGVSAGKFKITNSLGYAQTIELNAQTDRTIGDVLNKINAAPGLNVTARINDNGDGILLEDKAGGTLLLNVQESGGTTAADLNLRKQAAKDETTIDGSFETRIVIGAADTLQDVARKINEASGALSASVVNDGTRLDPYRLAVLSKTTGTQGRLFLDEGDTGLAFSTLVDARDAVVFFGAGGTAGSMPIVTSSNTVSGVVQGLTLELTGTSSQPVTVSVVRDAEKMVSDIEVFVKTYNDAVDRINKLTEFNTETLQGGVLFADSTIRLAKARMYEMLTKVVPGADAGYTRLSSVGLTLGAGAKLVFDSAKFKKAVETNAASVEKLFTLQKTVDNKTVNLGAGYVIQETIDGLTQTGTGLLSRQEDELQKRNDMFNERVKYMQDLLDRKQKRLEAEFQSMEKALAKLQQQQSAISSLASLASSVGSTLTGISSA